MLFLLLLKISDIISFINNKKKFSKIINILMFYLF